MTDAWDLKRAATFLGVSPRTLERYVARRMVPVIVLPAARVEGERGARGTRPIITFDPAALAEWRGQYAVGARGRRTA